MTIDGCGPSNTACPNGPVALSVEPFPSGGFPPAPYDPGYDVQACDTLTWDFGDGNSQVVVGSKNVVHNYPVPGNYTVAVTVSNTLGSATVSRSIVVATSPSQLTVVPPTISAMENAGSLTITVARTLDLSRTVSVDVVVNGASYPIPTLPAVSQPLSFAPNETQKSFTIPITNDSGYTGTRTYTIVLANPAGGVLLTDGAIRILDDEPQPVATIDPAVSVTEGNSGMTNFSIPVHLSGPPLLVDAYLITLSSPGTAAPTEYSLNGGPFFKAGQTSSVVTGSVRGDLLPEADETFTVTLWPSSTTSEPAIGAAKTATVTIINDDVLAEPIPALSTTALFVLAIAVMLVGVKLLR